MRYVVKNGVTTSVDEILAPFKTPVVLAQRRRAMEAYRKMCAGARHEDAGCQITTHAH